MKISRSPFRFVALVGLLLSLCAALILALKKGRVVKALREGVPPMEVARSLVPKHPVPMRTVFRECFLVNFQVEQDVMSRLLPPGIEPDLYDGKAWLSVVIAEMERMRPAFLPPLFGITYNQIVYRAVVRRGDERGVYFLRSDADNRLMSLAGDWLTFFRFHYSPMSFRREGHLVLCDLVAAPSERADIRATYDLSTASRHMPSGSAFAELAKAQPFLVELFVAFGTVPTSDDILQVRIKRGEWDIFVVEDLRGQYRLMQDSALFPPGSAVLDSVFYVKELPYYWHTLERRR
jgi:uncharacterized protein YqjF (DUF2071 family)